MTVLNLKEEAQALREVFPGAPEGFVELCIAEMALCSAKNTDYRSDADPLANFKRQATWVSLYPGLDFTDPLVIAMMGMLKQVDASLTLLSRGREGGVETIGTRLADVAVYAKLAMLLDEERRNAEA